MAGFTKYELAVFLLSSLAFGITEQHNSYGSNNQHHEHSQYELSQWGAWSVCSKDEVTQTRSRYCTDCNTRVYVGNNLCGDTLNPQTRQCQNNSPTSDQHHNHNSYHNDNHNDHARYYTWSLWGSWSSCHQVFQPGQHTTHTYTQDRTRQCRGADLLIDTLLISTISIVYPLYLCGNSNHTEARGCVVNYEAHWSPWTAWTSCRATCGGGSTVRVRHCGTNQTTCVGNFHETKSCGTTSCVVAPQWTSWSKLTACSATCGEGSSLRVRHCGQNQTGCVGKAYQIEACLSSTCVPQDHWSLWTDWTSCGATCGGGSTVRVRYCATNQTTCVGDSFETKPCGTTSCIALTVDGEWGTWEGWSACSNTCDLGVKKRRRSCDSPAPKNGGHPCRGAFSTTTTCKTTDCSHGN